MSKILTIARNVIYAPPGYVLRRVKRWGEDDIMIRATYDVNARGNVGQFQVIEPYVVRADGMWVGQWGAVSPNFSSLAYADMHAIAALQIIDGGYNVSQKMNYLYHEKTGTETVAEIWGTGTWDITTDAKYGQMVHGGQMVAVSDEVYQFRVVMPGEISQRLVAMRRLLLCRRNDLFTKSYATHPWLIQKATVAGKDDNSYGEYPRGTVYMCGMLDPQDFPTGNQAAKAYLPEEWLV